MDSLESLAIKKKGFEEKNKKKSNFFIAIGIFVFIITLLYFLGIFEKRYSVEIVTVGKMYPYQSKIILNASGYVVADKKAAVASKLTGRLTELLVEEGQKVKKDQIIARLENEDAKAALNYAKATYNTAVANVKLAQAELDDAKKSFEREKVLMERGFSTQSEFDAAEARYKKALAAFESAQFQVKAAESNIKNAEVNLEYSFIRAPFDGVILTKNADVGDIVTPLGAAANAKAAVVTMADLNTLYVEADVSESLVSKIKKKSPCVIQLDGVPDKIYKGFIHMVVPTADRTKSSVVIKVKFREIDSRVLPDMSAKVSILEEELEKEDVLPEIMISTQSIRKEGNRKFVFIVEKDKAILKEINTKEMQKEYTVVKEGLFEGEKIIINPPIDLKNGSKIKVVTK